MKKRIRNVLFSTTRQWNPGDEFILYGVMNLLKEIMGEFNPIIYNRNPDICREHYVLSNKSKKKFIQAIKKLPRGSHRLLNLLHLEQYDNSIKLYESNTNIDLCVFAGSPEWYQERLTPLYDYLNKNNIPCIYLGIGLAGEESFDNIKKRCGKALLNAAVITVRDEYTYKVLEKLHPTYMSCPALLSSPCNRLVTKVNRIGLIYGTNQAVYCNNISEAAHRYIYELYNVLGKQYTVELVCHYIDELEWANRDFPDLPIRYSYNSWDYFEIFNRYDLVIGPRVHGIGISASMGIPGIAIKHDRRGDTVIGFGAKIINDSTDSIDDALKEIQDSMEHIEKYSQELLNKKEAVKNKYITLLSGTDTGLKDSFKSSK